MNSKTESVKKFINQTGKENQLFLFVGSNDNNLGSNSALSEIQTWKDSDFSIKVGKDNLIGVVPNVKWSRSKIFTAWQSNYQNDGNFYAYNETNGYVYLCISNNINNRIDLEGKIASTYMPSHVGGDYTYDDGYTWKALYKITPSLERFITDRWIPVVSFDNYENLDKNNQLSQIQSYCYPSTTSTTGKCSLYFKENIKYYNSSGVETNGVKGSLFYTFSTLTCSECYNMFKDNPVYVSVFTSSDAPSTIEIKDVYDIIGELIDSNKISTSSPYFYLYQANKNSPDEGYIVCAKIDLSGFSEKDRAISEENPYLTVLSNSGSDGTIQLITYNHDGVNYIDGIQVISKGSGYKDIKLNLTSATMLGSKTVQDLLASIRVDLDEVDGLGFDPMKELECKHVMIDVKIDKPTLETSGLPTPNHINFYSLVQNPKFNTGSIDIIGGSTENKYLSTLYRTTTKISVTAPTSGGIPILPDVDDVGKITFTSSKDPINDVKVSKPIPVIGGDSKIEIKDLENKKIKELLDGSAKLEINGLEYAINSVDEQPSLVQYTGKVLSTNKTANIPINDVDTAVICINMVKGM